MDYQACLEYVSRNCTRNIPGGFERTKRLAELAGSPQETLQIIHIAGTIVYPRLSRTIPGLLLGKSACIFDTGTAV